MRRYWRMCKLYVTLMKNDWRLEQRFLSDAFVKCLAAFAVWSTWSSLVFISLYSNSNWILWVYVSLLTTVFLVSFDHFGRRYVPLLFWITWSVGCVFVFEMALRCLLFGQHIILHHLCSFIFKALFKSLQSDHI